jgi:hypothetical protein
MLNVLLIPPPAGRRFNSRNALPLNLTWHLETTFNIKNPGIVPSRIDVRMYRFGIRDAASGLSYSAGGIILLRASLRKEVSKNSC